MILSDPQKEGVTSLVKCCSFTVFPCIHLNGPVLKFPAQQLSGTPTEQAISPEVRLLMIITLWHIPAIYYYIIRWEYHFKATF